MIYRGVEVRLTLLVIGLVLMSLGCIGETPPAKPQEATTTRESTPTQLITKVLDQLILSKSDLPSGFKLVEYNSGEGLVNVIYEMDGNSTEFLRNNPKYVGVLKISNLVAKLNSISEAQKAFEESNRKISVEGGMKLATDVIGDEASLYFKEGAVLDSRQLSGYALLFREKNVFSLISLVGLNTNMSEIIKYAWVVEGKIAESPIPKKPSTTTPPKTTPAPIEISAIQLCRAYEDNTIAADLKYKNKMLKVTGTVSNIGKNLWNDPYIALIGGGEYGLCGVQAFFSSAYEPQLAKLRKGQSVTVIGKCEGYYLFNILLTDARLVSEN